MDEARREAIAVRAVDFGADLAAARKVMADPHIGWDEKVPNSLLAVACAVYAMPAGTGPL